MGVLFDNTNAKTIITVADKANIAFHPHISATRLDIGRASIIPNNRPLMTLPTTRPRTFSDERYDTRGTSTCAATEPSPIKNEAINNKVALFTKTIEMSANALKNNNISINFYSQQYPPKAQRNNKPTTYPI